MQGCAPYFLAQQYEDEGDMSTTANKLKQKCHEYLWSKKYSRQGKAQVVCEETVAKKNQPIKARGREEARVELTILKVGKLLF